MFLPKGIPLHLLGNAEEAIEDLLDYKIKPIHLDNHLVVC